MKRDYLRRWWCSKYNLPSTDPRLSAYLPDELMIEFLEDHIDDELFELDKDGDPAIVTVDEYGIDTLETGVAELDEDFKWLAEERRKSIEMRKSRSTQKGEQNVLPDLLNLVKQEKGKDV